MAVIANTFFVLLVLLSLSLQPTHARESKFFTKVIRYLSNSPAPTPVVLPGLVPVADQPVLAPAPALAEKEFGYGLYGEGGNEFSSDTSTLDHGSEKATPEETEEVGRTPAGDEFTSEKEAPFEKLLSSESYSTNNNAYSSSMNDNNGYNNINNKNSFGNQNGNNKNENSYTSFENNNNENGNNEKMYSNNYNDNGNGYSMNQNSAYNNNQNGYNNDEGYFRNDESSKNEFDTMEEERQGGFVKPKDNGYNNNENGYNFQNNNNNDNNNGYVMEQQGLSDSRFFENGKYFYDANKNHEEEMRDNGKGYFKNNKSSKYEFDTMEEYERQEGYPENDQRGYVP